MPIDHRNIDSWKRFFRTKQWNSFKILEQLQVSLHLLESLEKENILGIDLQICHSFLATIRHAFVHSSMVVNRDRFQASSDSSRPHIQTHELGAENFLHNLRDVEPC